MVAQRELGEKMKILVCGSRTYQNAARVNEILSEYLGQVDLIIDGGATGADSLACLWAINNKIGTKRYFAKWNKYRRRAGPMRNQKMIDVEYPDLVIAFPPGEAGTHDMVARAGRAGIRVRKVDWDEV